MPGPYPSRQLHPPPRPPLRLAKSFFPLGEPVAAIRGCVIVWAGVGTETPVLPPGAPLIWPSGRAFRASESGPCGATLDLATPSGASWEPLPASAPALPAAGGGGAYTSPAGFIPPCGTPYDGAPYTITGAYCPPTGKRRSRENRQHGMLQELRSEQSFGLAQVRGVDQPCQQAEHLAPSRQPLQDEKHFGRCRWAALSNTKSIARSSAWR